MAALTLTGLVPVVYEAMDIVSRETVGFIPAVSRDFSGERAALGQTITSPVVGAMAAEDIVAAAYAADTPAQTIGTVSMSITKSRAVPFGITGEETMALGSQLPNVNRDRIAQAIRTITNEIESDLAALYLNASRANGSTSNAPFNTAGDLSDVALARQILEDNGAPQTDLHMVLGSAAIANLRGKQNTLFKVNEAGTDALLRQGAIGDLEGFMIHNSAQVRKTVAAGTGASATTNTAGYAIGATSITLASAGTGTIIAGDVISFAGDTNKYVVTSGDTDVSNGGTITIQEPGLLKAIPASATAITVTAASTRNMFFHRSAIQLIARAPAMPEGGDSADDSMIITDPYSGLSYEMLIYRQRRQTRYEICAAWGVKTVIARNMGLLLGA